MGAPREYRSQQHRNFSYDKNVGNDQSFENGRNGRSKNLRQHQQFPQDSHDRDLGNYKNSPRLIVQRGNGRSRNIAPAENFNGTKELRVNYGTERNPINAQVNIDSQIH